MSDKNIPAPRPQQPKKRRSYTWLIVCLCVLLALGAGIGGTYFYLNLQSDNAAEERAYRDLALSNSSSDYRAFLDSYPSSPHAREVEEQMRKLQAMERDWSYIERSANKNDFVDFKNRHQNPLYDRLCDHKIDSLDWTMARLDDTLEAYRRYMQLHPDGQYYTEAATACKTAESHELEPEEEEEVRAAVADFFGAFGRNAADEIREYIAPRMDRFLNKTHVSADDVVAAIGRMYGSHIQSCTFRTNALTIGKDGGSDEGVTFTARGIVTQEIERDNEGRRHGTYRMNAVLDRNYRLTSLTLTEQKDKED